MMSEYFDADLTVFGRGREVPFSPFRGVFDEEKVAFLDQPDRLRGEAAVADV